MQYNNCQPGVRALTEGVGGNSEGKARTRSENPNSTPAVDYVAVA